MQKWGTPFQSVCLQNIQLLAIRKQGACTLPQNTTHFCCCFLKTCVYNVYEAVCTVFFACAIMFISRTGMYLSYQCLFSACSFFEGRSCQPRCLCHAATGRVCKHEFFLHREPIFTKWLQTPPLHKFQLLISTNVKQ